MALSQIELFTLMFREAIEFTYIYGWRQDDCDILR